MNINNTVYTNKKEAEIAWEGFVVEIKQQVVYPLRKHIKGRYKTYYYDSYKSQKRMLLYGDTLLQPIVMWVVS